MDRLEDRLIGVYADLIWTLHNVTYYRKLAILRKASVIIPGVRFTLESVVFGKREVSFVIIDDFGDYDWWYNELHTREDELFADGLFPVEMESFYEVYRNRAKTVRGAARICFELMQQIFGDSSDR